MSAARHRNHYILHISRSIAQTTGWWNDLYGPGRRLQPGSLSPPVAVTAGIRTLEVRWELSAGQRRRFYSASFFGALYYVLRTYNRARRRHRVLIVHVHSPVLAAIVVLARLLAPGLGIVVTQRNDWRFFKWRQKVSLRVLARTADRFVTCGYAIVDTIPTSVLEGMKARHSLATVPNAIPAARLREIQERVQNGSRPRREADRIGVVVARMVPQKNCFFALDVIAQSKRLKQVHWFGDGYLRKQIEGEIERRGLGDRVLLLGRRPQDQVLEALATFPVYLATSKWEGLSVADLQAVGLGCYPFMSRIPQRIEIATVLGLPTLPLDSPAQWGAAIDAFLTRPIEDRERLRHDLASRAQAHYDSNVMVERYSQVYDGAAALARLRSNNG